MNFLNADCDQLLVRHRPYLMLLARARILPINGRKVDASDIVQQTLLDATYAVSNCWERPSTNR